MKTRQKLREKIMTNRIKFYKKLDDSDKEELWDLFSDYERYRLNLKIQKQIGFGKNRFTFEEYGLSKDISKYKNLKEWDKEQYTYQKKHGQTNLDSTYNIYLFGDWCRFIENKKLIYGMTLSTHGYIFDQVVDKLMKFENSLYPHTVDIISKKKKKKLKNPLTKKKEHFYTMDFKTHAYGREEELEKLKKFIMNFEHEVLYPKIKKYVAKHLNNRTYRVVEKKETFDNFHQFLFSDQEALANITFNNFLSDFNKLKRDSHDLKKIEKKFVKYSKEYIMKNFYLDIK